MLVFLAWVCMLKNLRFLSDFGSQPLSILRRVLLNLEQNGGIKRFRMLARPLG
jgi:hypothetical protein